MQLLTVHYVLLVVLVLCMHVCMHSTIVYMNQVSYLTFVLGTGVCQEDLGFSVSGTQPPDTVCGRRASPSPPVLTEDWRRLCFSTHTHTSIQQCAGMFLHTTTRLHTCTCTHTHTHTPPPGSSSSGALWSCWSCAQCGHRRAQTFGTVLHPLMWRHYCRSYSLLLGLQSLCSNNNETC